MMKPISYKTLYPQKAHSKPNQRYMCIRWYKWANGLILFKPKQGATTLSWHFYSVKKGVAQLGWIKDNTLRLFCL